MVFGLGCIVRVMLFWVLVLFVLLVGICVSGGLLTLCFEFVVAGIVWLVRYCALVVFGLWLFVACCLGLCLGIACV